MNLNNLKTNDDIKLDNDYTGSRTLESGAYKMTIDYAYLHTADSGAMALSLQGTTESGAKVTQQFYMTSGTAKGGKNTYTDKNGKEQYLPGFSAANSLALLTVGKDIADTEIEEKVINLYDYSESKELPTKVQMFVDLLGQEVIAGVQKQIVDKQAKNDDGRYVATGETRVQNEIVKFFRASDSRTVTEILDQTEEAAYIHIWTEQNEGNTVDKSSGEAATKSGAPAASGQKKAASKTASLFS